MDARTWSLILNTLLLCAATCAISVPLGTLLAWLLGRTDLPGRRVGIVSLGLLLFVPLYLQAAAWQAGFGPQGWYTRVFGGEALLSGWVGAIWVHAAAAVPWVALIVGLGLRLIEPELEEQALLDGSTRQVAVGVTLRGALPAAGVAGLWVAVTTAGEMTVTDLFVVRTYAEELYTRIAVGPPPGEGPLALLPGVVLTAALVAAAVVLCARLAPHDRPLSLRRRWRVPLGRWRVPMTILIGAVLLLLIGVPLANLTARAGMLVVPTDGGPVRTWSLVRSVTLVVETPFSFGREFGWSLLIAASAASATTAMAIVLGWLARGGRWRAVPALVVASVGLAMPGPLLGLGIIRLLNQPSMPWLFWLYDQSILAPCLAQVVRSLPLATLVMWHALRTVPPGILDSAAADGAGPLRRLVLIALPNRLAAVALAWVVAMAVALGDLGATILVVPPGVETLSIQVFGLLHSGQDDLAAGICLALLLLYAIVVACVFWLVSRMIRPEDAE